MVATDSAESAESPESAGPENTGSENNGSVSAAQADATYADTARRLAERFPALFGAAAQPLKLRIQNDIQERAPGEFSKQALSAFFRRHTHSTAYLQAVAKGTQRFDLDGQPAGELSEEHRQLAADELARRKARHQERRQQEREKMIAERKAAFKAQRQDEAQQRQQRAPRLPRPPALAAQRREAQPGVHVVVHGHDQRPHAEQRLPDLDAALHARQAAAPQLAHERDLAVGGSGGLEHGGGDGGVVGR